MKNIGCVLFYCLAIVFSSKVHAQSPLNGTSVGLQWHKGSFLINSPKAQYLRDSYSYFGELYFQQQTNGSRAWHRANNLPQWGAGLFFGHTGSQQYMGNMAGAFTFINLPLLKKGIFSSQLRSGIGLGWVQHPYDKISNHKNVLIGSAFNAYINFLWKNELQLTPLLAVNAGLSFSHLSNGGSTLPNLGLNIPAFSVGLKYGAGSKEKIKDKNLPTYNKKWSYQLLAAAGIKQAPWVESSRYLINTFNAEVSRRFSYSDYIGGGLVIFYDRSLEIHPAGIPTLKRKNNKVQAGVYMAYEHAFGRLSVPLQLGMYVFNKDLSPLLFQNLGFRYQISQKLSGQFLMKTHMGKADHVSLGLGYTLK
jgi:hypothetical protein